MLHISRRIAAPSKFRGAVSAVSSFRAFSIPAHIYARNENLDHRLSLSKIVATIGPTSENLPVLPEVASAGMRIMRINFSHATYEEALLRVTNLRTYTGLNNKGRGGKNECTNVRAIMLDTQGPEIRTGSWVDKDGKPAKAMYLEAGKQVLAY